MFLRGELRIGGENSNFIIFESTLYMKSGSMPLRVALILWLSLLRGGDNISLVYSDEGSFSSSLESVDMGEVVTTLVLCIQTRVPSAQV